MNQQSILDFHPGKNDLRIIRIGVGWKKELLGLSLLQRLGIQKKPDFTVDLMALLLNENAQLENPGVVRDFGGGRLVAWVDSDLVHFNNLQHPSGAVWLADESLPLGMPGEADQIFIRLSELPLGTKEVAFWLCVRHASTKSQHLGQLKGLFFRISDAQEKTMRLQELPPSMMNQVACLELGRLQKNEANWQFSTTMQPLPFSKFTDGLQSHANIRATQ